METFESKFTDKHFIALGKINVYFQKIESVLDILLSTLLNANSFSPSFRKMHALLSESSFRTKFSTACSIVNEISSFEDISDAFSDMPQSLEGAVIEHIEKFKLLIKKIDECSAIRNKYLHSHWIDGSIGSKFPESVARTKTTAKGKKINGEFDFETVEKLQKKVFYIEETYKEMLDAVLPLHSFSAPNNLTNKSSSPAEERGPDA